MNDQRVKVSILIATRNRPDEFLVALESVLNQSYENIEVIVVNDGSEEEHLSRYQGIELQCDGRVTFIYLPLRPKGHGPSFARNTAAYKATGDYIAFLDDDDLWTDRDHLRRFVSVCVAKNGVDLYLSNQRAVYSDGESVTDPIWIESLKSSSHQQESITESAVTASVEWLLTAQSFAHLNCTIVARELFEKVQGFDETLRYEEDKDLYWRLLDNAKLIVFDKSTIAQHYIPQNRQSASSDYDDINKRRIQLNIAEKNFFLSKNKDLKRVCRRSISYACKHISEYFKKENSHDKACYYAARALIANFELKWMLFTILLFIENKKKVDGKN